MRIKKKVTFVNKKSNLLIYSELASLITYKKKIIKHPYVKKKLPFFFYIKQICFYLKKNMQIIFKYHINKKKILFIIKEKTSELKKKNFYYSFKKAKHSFIPKSAWMNGLISNQNFMYNHIFKKKKWLLKQVNKNYMLTVSQNFWNGLNTECYNKRIPQIILNTYLELKDYYIKKDNTAYYLPVNFEITLKKKIENYFFNIIKKILRLEKVIKFKKKIDNITSSLPTTIPGIGWRGSPQPTTTGEPVTSSPIAELKKVFFEALSNLKPVTSSPIAELKKVFFEALSNLKKVTPKPEKLPKVSKPKKFFKALRPDKGVAPKKPKK